MLRWEEGLGAGVPPDPPEAKATRWVFPPQAPWGSSSAPSSWRNWLWPSRPGPAAHRLCPGVSTLAQVFSGPLPRRQHLCACGFLVVIVLDPFLQEAQGRGYVCLKACDTCPGQKVVVPARPPPKLGAQFGM